MKNISDDQLKAYFLGKLSEPEAEILEIECTSNVQLTEHAQVVEGELADDFLRGNLSAADASLFEKKYLITAMRRDKLRVAKGLRMIASEPKAQAVSAAAPVSANSFWQTIFGKRKAVQFAFGGLILLLVFGGGGFYLLALKVDKNDIAEIRDANQTPKNETPPVKNPDDQIIQAPAAQNEKPKTASTNPVVQNKESVKDSTSPQKTQPAVKTASIPKNVERNKSALVMVVKLLPGSLRDEGEQFVTIMPDVKNLNLLLSPSGEPINYKIFRAVLKTPEDGIIFTSPNLKALSLPLPAEKLENRTYIISLEGKNPQSEFESIADYTFRVRR